MDALSRIHAAAEPLLTRVDRTIEQLGAPENDPIWTVLRRVGARPGDAVAEVTKCVPEPWRDRAELLRHKQSAFAEVSAEIAQLSAWEGAAGAAFAAKFGGVRGALRLQIEQAHALAEYFDRLADWAESGRLRLARVLADALASAEAMHLTANGAAAVEVSLTMRATAAARVGWVLLSDVEGFWTQGAELSRSFTQLPAAPPADASAVAEASANTTMRAQL